MKSIEKVSLGDNIRAFIILNYNEYLIISFGEYNASFAGNYRFFGFRLYTHLYFCKSWQHHKGLHCLWFTKMSLSVLVSSCNKGNDFY